jgi:hypothetical protein
MGFGRHRRSFLSSIVPQLFERAGRRCFCRTAKHRPGLITAAERFITINMAFGHPALHFVDGRRLCAGRALGSTGPVVRGRGTPYRKALRTTDNEPIEMVGAPQQERKPWS